MNAKKSTAMDFLDYLCEKYRIKSWGTSWEYFRQYKQLYTSVTGLLMDRNDSKEIKKVRLPLPPTNVVANAPYKWHDAILVPKYNLRPPNILGKDVANADTLLVLLTFNIRYDTGIFSWERHRVQLPGCYLGLAFTGARPAEFVDREKKGDEYLKEIFQAVTRNIPDDEDKAPDEHSRLLEEIISQEYESRGRPKALCYEDILLMVVRHPETARTFLLCLSDSRTTKGWTISRSRK